MIYFDTLQYVKTLEASGVSAKQAEAMARAQQEALSECLDTTLVTKQDITDLKNEVKSDISNLNVRVEKIESDVKWIQWALGFIGAGVGTLVLKAFF